MKIFLNEEFRSSVTARHLTVGDEINVDEQRFRIVTKTDKSSREVMLACVGTEGEQTIIFDPEAMVETIKRRRVEVISDHRASEIHHSA